MSDVGKFGEEFQKAGKDGFEATVRSFGVVHKGFQAVTARLTDYSKRAFDDAARAYERQWVSVSP